jgi:hypothetical protein
MRTLFQIFIVSILFFNAQFSFAESHVCLNTAGKKVFSNDACAKKGMKETSNDFSVTAANPVNAMILTADPDTHEGDSTDPQAQRRNIDPNQPIKLHDGKTHFSWPVLSFFIFMMAATAAFIVMLFARFYRVYHRKLSLDREW